MTAMGSLSSKALSDNLSSEQKEIAANARRQTSLPEASAADAPMDEAGDDESAYAGITMGETRAHYIEMVLEELQAASGQAPAEQAYNLSLLDEHRHAEEKLSIGAGVASDMDVGEQEALLESYQSTNDIRCDHRRYRIHPTELEASFKEIDEATDEVYNKDKDCASVMPSRHNDEVGMSVGTASSKEE